MSSVQTSIKTCPLVFARTESNCQVVVMRNLGFAQIWFHVEDPAVAERSEELSGKLSRIV